MEDLDIIIFTAVLILLFILFAIGTYLQFIRMEKNTFDSNTETGGVDSFIRFLSKIFN